MIKEIYDAVENLLKTEAECVRRYKGEFENDSDWNPILPCIMIRIDRVTASLVTTDNSVEGNEIEFALYVAAKNINESDTLVLCEKVYDKLDDNTIRITIDNENVELQRKLGDITYFGYEKGVEIYKIELKIYF